MKRIQIQNPITPPPITPAAEPVNTFYRPTLPEPTLSTIIDLSPLTDAFTDIAHNEAVRAGERGADYGKAAANALGDDELQNLISQTKDIDEAKAAVQQNQEKYAKEIAAGALPAYSSPHFQKSFLETVGRRAGLKYASALESKLAEASNATDANGDPLPPADLTKIKAEAWKQFGSSVFLKDRYANQSAQAIRAEADTRFESAVSQARGQAKLEFARKEATNELALYLKQNWTEPGFTPGDHEIATVWGFATEKVRLGNIGDPMPVVMNAIASVAAQEAFEVGPEAAASFLRNTLSIRVGNGRLDKDAKSSKVLSNLIAEYENQADREIGREAAKTAAGVSKATRDAQGVYMAKLLLVNDAGGSAVAELKKTFEVDLKSARFGEFTPQAMDSMRAYAEALDNGKENLGEKLYNDLLYRIAQGSDMDSLASEIDSLVKGNQLSPRFAADLLNKSSVRRDLSPYLENNGAYRRALSEVDQANTVRGLPETAQREVDAFMARETESLETDAAFKAAEFAKPNGGGPAAFDTWLAGRKKETLTRIEAHNREVSAKREAAMKEIESKIDHGHAVDDLLQQNGSLIPVEEARRLKERGDRAADKSEFFGMEAYQNSSALLRASLRTDVGAQLEEKGIDVLRFDIRAQDDLKRRANSWLVQNQDKMTLSQLRPAFEVAMTDEILPAAQKYLKSLAPEIQDVVDVKVAKRLAQDAAGKSAKEYANTITSNEMWNPRLSESYKDMVRAYASGTGTGLWGNSLVGSSMFSISSDTMLEAADTELRFNLKAETPEIRAQAVVDAYGPVGFLNVDNVIKGKATIYVPQSRLEAYDRASGRARELLQDANPDANPGTIENILWGGDTSSMDPRTRFYVNLSRTYSKGIREPDPSRTVDISSAKINPYTTPLWRSKGEFKAWYDAADTKTLKSVLGPLGVPLDDIEVRDWVAAQNQAIERFQNAR